VAKEKKINEELQKVSSNNILEIFEIIETKQYVWYLTEYCSGGSPMVHVDSPRDTLNEIKNHKFSELETLNCILQIAKGVQELHNHRITHRDLKP
jgi:serine/threonine protein kinase